MAPPKGIQNVLDKFRTDFTKNQKVLADSARARDDKIKKKKKPATQARKKPSTTKASSGNSSQRSAQQDQAKWISEAKKSGDLPLGLRQKMVIDFLRDKVRCGSHSSFPHSPLLPFPRPHVLTPARPSAVQESPASWEDILNGSGRNLEAEADLKNALHAHPKVSQDPASGMYSYVPDANISSRNQLLEYVKSSSEPVAVQDLLDSYKKVTEDIEALKAERLLIGLFSYLPELNCEILYSTDGRLGKNLADLQSDADVTALWTNFSVPDTDDALDEALRKAGITPAPRKEKPKRLVSEKKKKKRKQSKLRSVTNAHLLHLLEGDVTSIDC